LVVEVEEDPEIAILLLRIQVFQDLVPHLLLLQIMLVLAVAVDKEMVALQMEAQQDH
jgi:hypothetical protein|tara:strand:- start:207 stop:377 length:171 start_codon:yes stop_codon:yes gene_type:complete